jgi:hypothetical protein
LRYDAIISTSVDALVHEIYALPSVKKVIGASRQIFIASGPPTSGSEFLARQQSLFAVQFFKEVRYPQFRARSVKINQALLASNHYLTD